MIQKYKQGNHCYVTFDTQCFLNQQNMIIISFENTLSLLQQIHQKNKF